MKNIDPLTEELFFTTITPADSSPHWYEGLEIIFVLQGTGFLHTGGGGDLAYPVKECDIFVVNRFQLCQLILAPSGLALALHISPKFLSIFCPEFAEAELECKSFLKEPDQEDLYNSVRRDFARTFQIYYKNESPPPILLRTKAAILLTNLIQHFLRKHVSKTDTHPDGWKRMYTATGYIHQHYSENITLDCLSSMVYLNSSYLSHLFQKQLGLTFTSYLVNVRLSHAIKMLQEKKSVTDIALETGFPSTSALIGAFKKKFGLTPGQYRAQISAGQEKEEAEVQSEGAFSHSFTSLMTYMETPDLVENSQQEIAEVFETHIDTQQSLRTLTHTWRFLANAGYAKDLQKGSIQRQLTQLQREIGYQYIRCKGILDDDMMLYTKSSDGQPLFNFVYVDEAVDFLLSIGALPWIELGFMPSALAQNKVKNIFKRPSIISMPDHLADWLNLIDVLLHHFSDRYGSDTIRQWIFAPFTTPEFSAWGYFSQEEYWEFYQQTVKAIRDFDLRITIAGVGIGIRSLEIQEEYLTYSQHHNCLPDIIALHAYQTSDPKSEDNNLHLMFANEGFPFTVSGDEDYLTHMLENTKKMLHKMGLNLPIVLDEWNSNVWQRDLCNDTCYKSTFIFKNILENYDKLDGMGYWTISDHIEEFDPPPDTFHGGFGLFTRTGLPKACYRALQLLKKSGSRLLQKGEGYFVTKGEGEIQIFLYNYCHYDTLYRYRYITHITKTERYQVFNTRSPRQYHLCLEGLSPGKYDERRFSIGPDGGSIYDAWISMGAPDEPQPEEQTHLENLSHPAYHRIKQECKDTYTVNTVVKPHEVQVILLSKLQ
jgi:xylan 1,4-beta-xylosidase